MQMTIAQTPAQLGQVAARQIAESLNQAIEANGTARLVLSTGASQFDTIEVLVQEPVAWGKVEMFHLDEYVGLPETHGASFRKYLKERFVQKLPEPLKAIHFVNGEGDLDATLVALNAAISGHPVDVGVIGIGENAHIAFNDPPADFDVDDPYIVVKLDEKCRKQQVGEGWFAGPDGVPEKAISMSVRQIMRCRQIITCMPYAVKAKAAKDTLDAETVTNMIPATILKTHPDWHLYLDSDSASLLNRDELAVWMGPNLTIL